MLAKGEFSQCDFYEPNSIYKKAILLYIPDQAPLHKHCRQSYYTGGVHPRGEAAAQQLRPPPPNQNSKNPDFIDTMISKVLRDLSFSLNQPLKSA
jgi:hypothetical protein